MTQSSWSAISDRIAAQMATITNIGRVWRYTRVVTDEGTFADVMTAELGDERRLRAWMIHPEVARVNTWAEQSGTTQFNRTAVIEGFFQVEDDADSERVAVGFGEAVIRVLNTDVRTTRLGATVLSGGPATFPSGHRPGEPRVFAFVLAHYVRVELPLWSLDTLT